MIKQLIVIAIAAAFGIAYAADEKPTSGGKPAVEKKAQSVKNTDKAKALAVKPKAAAATTDKSASTEEKGKTEKKKKSKKSKKSEKDYENM